LTGQVPGTYESVGKFSVGAVASDIIAAIKDLNQDVIVVDRGA